MLDLVLSNGQVVTSDGVMRANLGIKDGRIAQISTLPLSGKNVIDCTGQFILPAGIDVHVHVNSSELHPEGWERLSQCAAVGGIATVIDMPYDAPEPTINAERLARKINKLQKNSIVDAALYGTISKNDGSKNDGSKNDGINAISAMVEAGAAAFKFSTYETDPTRFPRIPNNQLLLALSELATAGLPCVFHAEDGEIIDAAVAQLRQLPEAAGPNAGRLHAQSRPPVSEMLAVASLLELARDLTQRGLPCKLHIAHLTVPHGFELIEAYQKLGVDVTAETCIHYLVLNEDDLATQGAALKCNPPLRTKAMQEGLWEQLKAGRVAFVTTDHAPWPPEFKAVANIFDNRSGMAGLEWMLPLLYSEGVVKRGLPITDLAKLLATAPAERFGLSQQKGRIAVGLDADLVCLDPQASQTIRAADSYSIAQHSPYEGWILKGKITRTIRRGETIFDGQRVVAQGGGQFVRPQRSKIAPEPELIEGHT